MDEHDMSGGTTVQAATDPPAAPVGPDVSPAPGPGRGSDPATALTGSLVYALGTIGYDLPTRSRRASLQQQMGEPGPDEPAALLAHLDEHPHDATAVQWTLNLQATPIYLIHPTGPFAGSAYELLRRFLREQADEGVERVSLAGTVIGTAPHRSGLELPVVEPEIRGMYSWTTEALVKSVIEAASKDGARGKAAQERQQQIKEGVRNFLERVYFELRNLGREPQERAINFAATNAFEAEHVYEQAIGEEMELDSIGVEPSSLCPPGSDCWDVKLVFFFPDRPAQTVRRLYTFTVDVADVVPATVGPMRSWSIR
jgi:cyanobactin maturation PatA/PatG family protease